MITTHNEGRCETFSDVPVARYNRAETVGVGAVCKHMDRGPEYFEVIFQVVFQSNEHLKFAWQFTSPCTAGVKGGISKRDRSRRNMPG